MLNRKQQRGSVAPMLILGFGGVLLATAYALDTTRMTSDASQLKRATDAAAMAVGQESIAARDDFASTRTALAEGYVRSNLGMDKQLHDNLSGVRVTEGKNAEGNITYTVSAEFLSQPALTGYSERPLVLHSTAEVVNRPTEVSLVIPNTGSEDELQLAALRRLVNDFSNYLMGDENSQRITQRNNLWISLVPYSQSVSVYDAQDPNRIRRWVIPGGLTPIELRSMLVTTGLSGLADRRFPDRRANLLCMYRGLPSGQNFYWDQPPSAQFQIYYRHDLPINGSPGAPPISWVGTNPDIYPDSARDTRFIVADRGCPSAALLPLTNDRKKIRERAEQFSSRFNVNYAIAMSWAAASLSPNMRGTAGWGDPKLPLNFNENGEGQNKKIIVMLANTVGDWFDTDAYNFERNKDIKEESRGFAVRRFNDLCQSFRQRDLKFFFIGVRPGDPKDFGRILFDRDAVPGLTICAANGGELTFADASRFDEGEAQIKALMHRIADQIRLNSYVRLVE
ncbi:Tad domain-containing protein [Pseudomonas sp. FW300-N2F2]|uniref:Tad domain-containing protein n=1 Tax=Pseudomonas sp. FW300-N2F2 TaxID=2751320 RepID=UPI001A911E53|nr:Tad domain-containing protein [Pseudomonas sp. FW300-N2F2]